MSRVLHMNLYERLNEMISYIEQHIDEKMGMQELAKFLGCSTYTMQRIFSMMTGFSITDYIRKRRLSLAVLKLKEGESVLDVALFCGYSSGEAFSRKFFEIYKIHPKDVKKKKAELTFQPILEFEPQSYSHNITYRIEERKQQKFYGEYRDIVGSIPKKAEPFWKTMKEKYPSLLEDLPRLAVIEEKEECSRYWILLKEEHENLEHFLLPEGNWLVFKGKSFEGKEIAQLCFTIYDTYLKAIPYKRNEKYTLELYYEDYMEVWIFID